MDKKEFMVKAVDDKKDLILELSDRIYDFAETGFHEFKSAELFEDMLCKPWPPVDKNKEEYGVTILENGLVDISNKDKAEVLASLYNNSHPQGLGFREFRPEPMTVEEAREILKEKAIFDYLYGRVMKINLENDLVCTSWYNKVNGEGAAEKAISQCPNLK